jgi:hypothetical protein
VAALTLLAVVPAPVGQALADLSPEHAALLQRVRDNIARDDDAMRRFAYTMERRSYQVSLLGKVSNGDVHTYEVGPSPFEPGRTWRRLVAVNGVPIPADRRRRDEEKARRQAEATRRERERETPAARAIRLREDQEEAQKDRERLADVERVFRFSPSGDEVVDGVRTLVFLMTPRPGVQTRSDVGRHLDKLRGRIWVDPAASQLARAEFETTGDVTIGLGVIGRVSRGSRMLYRRAQAAEGSWVPVEARFQGSGRTLMLIPFHLETWAKYAGFRPAELGDTPGHVAPSPR